MPKFFEKLGNTVGVVVGMGGEWQRLKVVVSFSERISSPFSGEFLIVEEIEEPRRKLVCFVEEPAYGDYSTTESAREKTLVDKYMRELADVGTELSEEEKKALFFRCYYVRVLGEIVTENGRDKVKTVYRFLPELTAICRYPKKEEYQVILSAGLESGEDAIKIGSLAIGDNTCDEIPVKFNSHKFLSVTRGPNNEVLETTGRRTAILARTGYGKSNLSKVILYHIGQMNVPILIGDLNGEYAFSSSQGKGLADIPSIRERLVVYTNKPIPEGYGDVFVRPLKIDFGKVYPREIAYLIDSTMELAGAQQFENTPYKNWNNFVSKYNATPKEQRDQTILEFISGSKKPKSKNKVQDDEIESDTQTGAIIHSSSRSAVNWRLRILMSKLHEAKGPDVINEVLFHLANNMIVVIDLSAIDTKIGLDIMGMVMQGLFKNNSDGFTGDRRSMIPSIIILEEAQNVLSPEAIKNESSIYVRTAKEGRKLGISLVYITQQPGSIANAVLSQSDNYFVMHVLNKEDVDALVKANNHYSGIISRFLQNEALMGNAYIYSAPYQPYVFPASVIKFEDLIPQNPSFAQHSYEKLSNDLVLRLKKERPKNDVNGKYILMGRLQYILSELIPANHTWLEISHDGSKKVKYIFTKTIMDSIVPTYGLGGEISKIKVGGEDKTIWSPDEDTTRKVWG